MKGRTYVACNLKSFYASVECILPLLRSTMSLANTWVGSRVP